MFQIPSLDQLRETLQDASSPIGKRMRAAYYCKQLFTNLQKNKSDPDDCDVSHQEQQLQQQQQTEAEAEAEAEAVKEEDEIVELLSEQLLHNSKHGSLMRHEFAYVLGQLQTFKACETLETLLLDDTDCVMVRHEAAEALGAIANPASIPCLQTTHQQYTGIVNELADTAQLALNRIQNPHDDGDDDDIAVGCACMLAPYSSVDPIAADPKHESLSVEQVGNILLSSSDSNSNSSNRNNNNNTSKTDFKHLTERYRAMFTLRNRGGEECVAQLCRALVDDTSSPLLRHEVAFVLGQLQHPSSIDALIVSLERQEEHVMVRHESAEALGAIDNCSSQEWKRIETVLTQYQQDPVTAVAESCIVALDAADYWGHNNNNAITIQKEQEQESTTFGQQKRLDESIATTTTATDLIRKEILAQHFNVAATVVQTDS